jgi:DDE superfamily endonuclease
VTLAQNYISILKKGWEDVFADRRTHRRAVEHALAWPSAMGDRTISQSICMLGRSQQDWNADYKLFSRSPWKAEHLFDPVIDEYLKRYPKGPVVMPIDDTKVHKTGKHIPGTSWQRDPMSPPFHVNFIWGLRFLQASLVFPHHQEGNFSARAFPVRFQHAPVVRKPRKGAIEDQLKQYRALRKQENLSAVAWRLIQDFRQLLDRKGAADRTLLIPVDGSFCNQTFFKTPISKVDLLARCRKDARLCFPDRADSRRTYAVEVFTPEDVRQSDRLAWKQTRIFFGSKCRKVRYKVLDNVLWRRGAGPRTLRLIVIAPVPYKMSPHSRINYRDPAYLLTTDLKTSSKKLLQHYFDRWQIEVNHRDEKTILAVGHSQLWSPLSVPRQPAFTVACYSMLLLACLRHSGPGRTHHFGALPKWRKSPPKRPSLPDMLTLLRKNLCEASVSSTLDVNFGKNITIYSKT